MRYSPGMIIKGAKLIEKIDSRHWLMRWPWGTERIVNINSFSRMKYRTRFDDISGFSKVFQHYKITASSRNLIFELSREDALKIFLGICHYCKCPPSNSQRTKNGKDEFKYSGIDRRDNNKGYSVENCVSCCASCNRIKSNLLTEEEMIAAMKAVSEIRQKNGRN